MMERILLRSSRNSLTLMTNSCSHIRASVSSRIRYYIPADDVNWGSQVLRDDSDQYARCESRRCTLADSAVQSDEMFGECGMSRTSDSSEEETRRWCTQILQSSIKKMVYYQILRWTLASWKQMRTPQGKNARPHQSSQSSLASRTEKESVCMLETRVQRASAR